MCCIHLEVYLTLSVVISIDVPIGTNMPHYIIGVVMYPYRDVTLYLEFTEHKVTYPEHCHSGM